MSEIDEESKNRKNKSISFDLTDAYEKDLLDYAERTDRGKFSRYIKRLIAEDRTRNEVSGNGRFAKDVVEDNRVINTSSVVEKDEIGDIGNKDMIKRDEEGISNDSGDSKLMNGFL